VASAAIEVRDLRKAYGPVEAVRGLSFEVDRGEVYGLLGPNGAGKTTTVEILEGYRARSAGEVRVLGHDPAERDRELQQRVGIVLQSCGFYPRVTVREAVEHFSKAYERPRDPGETIQLVGLDEKADSRAKDLSGGQRRRLDLALALVGDPELVFLDEPTTGFDPAARRGFWRLIEDLAAEGTTILLTTHYLEEAERLAGRVAVMARGRILDVAPPTALGGRQQAGTTVSWTEPDGRSGSTVTTAPTQVVAELGARFGGEVPGLTVARPTLEDVYLAMVDEQQ
jgi:ABC-2 type transport system ATP-binding protein